MDEMTKCPQCGCKFVPSTVKAESSPEIDSSDMPDDGMEGSKGGGFRKKFSMDKVDGVAKQALFDAKKKGE